MLRIDAHQHFWNFDPVRDSWINHDMSVIRRDFLPEDLVPSLDANGFDGSIAVQADQSEAENEFLLGLAKKSDEVKAVVGWVDLRSEAIEDRLQYYAEQPKMKGFRHILQGEKDRALMLQPAFMNGISKLKNYDFTYDILIFQDQLGYAYTLCKKFSDQRFIIDHIAKPDIRSGKISEWKKGISDFRGMEHVYCKVSGLVTEANWRKWTQDNFKKYLDTVVEVFGVKRLVFGTDWPVCLLAANYDKVVGIAENYFSRFSTNEKELIFGGNATSFYRLKQ